MVGHGYLYFTVQGEWKGCGEKMDRGVNKEPEFELLAQRM
jgi:hypothetical protein